MCSRDHLNKEVNLIKGYAARNGFPKRIANYVFKQTLQTYDSNTTRYEKAKKTVNLNFLVETAERLLLKS